MKTDWKNFESSAEHGIYIQKKSKKNLSIIVYTDYHHSQGGGGSEADYKSFRYKCKLWDCILSMHGLNVLDEVIAACDTLIENPTKKELYEIVFSKKWGNDSTNISKELKSIFSMVRLSPSWCNIQPWRFMVKDKVYALMYKRTLKENLLGHKSAWGNDYGRFDVGIALSHFQIAAQMIGYKGNWNLSIDEKQLKNLKIPYEVELIAVWE